MAAPGVAVPGSVVAIGSQVSPAGAQGIQGPAAVSANANNKATLGSDSLILVQGTAAGVAATTHAQTVSGDDPQLTNSRAPTAHAATHLSAGSDPVAAATATAAGLVPTPPNNTTTFLRGDATFATPTGIVPSAHASTHVTGGSDIIGAFTSTVSGLVPASGGGTANFLRADGTFQPPPGGGGTKTVAVLRAGDNMPPATNYAVFAVRNNNAVLAFNDTTAWTAMFASVMPQGASLGSGLVVTISWLALTATTGAVVWKVQFDRASAASGDNVSVDSFDVAVSATTTTNATLGKLSKTAITITTIDSIAAEDGYRIQVIRDAANAADTMVGDAQVFLVEVATV